MRKIYIPFAHAKNIYDIDVSFFKRNNINVVLVDLDNTLDSYRTLTPSENALKLKKLYNDNKIDLIIVSNNTSKRVSKYAKILGVEFWHSIGKPFSFGLNKKLKKAKIDKNSVVLIGDQTTTDVACGNRAKIKTILTDKLVEEDQWTTRFNRLFDNPRRKKLIKKGLLINWRNK